MNTKITAEALWNLVNCDPANPEIWEVVPAMIGIDPLTHRQILLDHRLRPIADREDEHTWILEPDESPYPFLDRLRFIDDIEHNPLGGVRDLPEARRLIDEWGLGDEIIRRIELFKQGKLPLPKFPSG